MEDTFRGGKPLDTSQIESVRSRRYRDFFRRRAGEGEPDRQGFARLDGGVSFQKVKDEVRRPETGNGKGSPVGKEEGDEGFVGEIDIVDETVAILSDGLVHPGPGAPVVIRDPPVFVLDLEPGRRVAVAAGIQDDQPAFGEIEEPAHLLPVFQERIAGKKIVILPEGADDGLEGGEVGIEPVDLVLQGDKGGPGGELEHGSVGQGDEDIIRVGRVDVLDGGSTGGSRSDGGPGESVVHGDGPAVLFRFQLRSPIRSSGRYFRALDVPEPFPVERPVPGPVGILPDTDGRGGLLGPGAEIHAASVAERERIAFSYTFFLMLHDGSHISAGFQFPYDGLKRGDVFIDPLHGRLQRLDCLLVRLQLALDLFQPFGGRSAGIQPDAEAEGNSEEQEETAAHR